MSTGRGADLSIRIVRTWPDAFRLRAVRNAVAPYMTRRTTPVGVLEQARWFLRVYRPGFAAGVIVVQLLTDRGRPAGYGLVTVGEYQDWGPQAKGWWVSGGLLPEYRGHGLGRILFTGLTAMAASAGDGHVLLEVREDNAPARALYASIGYLEIARAEREGIGPVLLMVKPKEPSRRAANLRRGVPLEG